MASPLARPLAVLASGLLLAGLLQAAPASADEATTALTVTVTSAGSTAGQRADDPFDVGPDPGSATLDVVVENTGTEAVQELELLAQVVDNGSVSGPACDLGTVVEGVGRVLDPGASSACSLTISGVLHGSLHEDVTTVTGTGTDSGTAVSAEAHFFAKATDPSVRLGGRVWLDTDRDGAQDPDEPGISGVRLDVEDPADLVLGSPATSTDGSYGFTPPPLPSGSYTVAVDTSSSALAGLEPTTPTSRRSVSGLSGGESDLGLDFGFAAPAAPAKASVSLTVDARPGTAVVGSTVTVKGSIERDGKAFKTTTSLERRLAGSSTWSTLKAVKSSSKGALSTTLKADRSADYRFHFAGDRTTEAGTSPADSVEVRKATIRLTVSAPGSVTKGRTIKVKGSVEREGKKYRTTTVLEFSSDGGDRWSTVKKVKSSSKGALSASVKPSRTGEYRYRFAGNSTTDAGSSPGDRVTVKPKPPAKPKPKAYKNCTALHKVYPHGVGRSGAKDETSGDPVTDFVRDTKTYGLNKKSDRDKDGIACEQ